MDWTHCKFCNHRLFGGNICEPCAIQQGICYTCKEQPARPKRYTCQPCVDKADKLAEPIFRRFEY